MIKDREVKFTFATKEELDEYADICWTIWGGVPCDVGWAMGTGIYQNELKKRIENKNKK